MRSLSATSNTQKELKNSAPINYITIEWLSGSVNYSDRPLTTPVVAEARVLNWGDFRTEAVEDRGSVSSLSLTLADYNHDLLGETREDEVQGVVVSYFQTWGVLGSSDLLFKGVISRIDWSEDPQRQATIVVDGTEKIYDERIGTFATRDVLPEMRLEDEGKLLPLVFGDVERSYAVQAIASPKTTLLLPLTASGDEAVVTDGRDFPQNTNLDIFINRELVRARLIGNRLLIYTRGLVIESGSTVGVSPNFLTFRANLTPQGSTWIGFGVRFHLPGGIEERVITNFTSPNIYGTSIP